MNDFLEQILMEAKLTAFDEFVPPAVLQKAKQALSGKSEIEILNLARQEAADENPQNRNNKWALLYIFGTYAPRLSTVYRKYFLNQGERQDNDSANEFLSLAWSEISKPLAQFNPEKVPEGDGFINKFAFMSWFPYLQQTAAQEKKRRNNSGITGTGEGNAQVQSIHSDRYEDGEMELSSSSAHEAETDIANAYERWFGKQSAKDQDILEMLQQDREEAAIAKYFSKYSGASQRVTFQTYVKKLKLSFMEEAGLLSQ
jgi:hypothetical protein